MPDKRNKYDIGPDGRTYGRDRKGGWDIDTSDRTHRTSDGGHIPGRYQWEETVDVSDDDDDYQNDQYRQNGQDDQDDQDDNCWGDSED